MRSLPTPELPLDGLVGVVPSDEPIQSEAVHSSPLEVHRSNLTPRMSTEVGAPSGRAEPPHGSEFVSCFGDLAGAVMGLEAAHVLRVVYAKEGVR